MTKYMVEILEEVNKDPSALAKYRESMALKMLFQYAFLPEKKFELPEGEPPFKKDAAPLGMSPANLTQEIKRFYVFTKERPLNPLRKEALFIQLLENVHPSEAQLLIAIKDQELTKLYKNVTVNLLVDNGFLPQEMRVHGKKTPKKS